MCTKLRLQRATVAVRCTHIRSHHLNVVVIWEKSFSEPNTINKSKIMLNKRKRFHAFKIKFPAQNFSPIFNVFLNAASSPDPDRRAARR